MKQSKWLPVLPFLVVSTALLACNGTSVGNPAPVGPDDCDPEQKTTLSDDEGNPLGWGGASADVATIVRSVEGTFTSELQWLDDEDAEWTNVTVSLTAGEPVELSETGPDDLPHCQDKYVIFPIRVTYETDDGQLAIDLDGTASLDQEGVAQVRAETALSTSADLTTRYPDKSGESLVKFHIVFAPSDEPSGAVTIHWGELEAPSDDTVFYGSSRIAQFPAVEYTD